MENKSWIEILDSFDEFLYSKDYNIAEMGLVMLKSSLPIKFIDNIEEINTLNSSFREKIRTKYGYIGSRYKIIETIPYSKNNYNLIGKILTKINNHRQKLEKLERLNEKSST